MPSIDQDSALDPSPTDLSDLKRKSEEENNNNILVSQHRSDDVVVCLAKPTTWLPKYLVILPDGRGFTSECHNQRSQARQ